MINKNQAISIASAEAKARGFTWIEPADANLSERKCGRGIRKVWRVVTNVWSRGVNTIIEIDADTGEVLSAHFMPR